MITLSFNEWSDNPVITTIDSIATPIDLIQFPTVTVCSHKDQPNNWAFLENLLNNLLFSCNNLHTKGLDIKLCEDTDSLRRDFHFFIASIVNLFKDWIFQDDQYALTRYHLIFKNRSWESFPEPNLGEKGSMNQEIIDLIIENFSKIVNQKEVYQIIPPEGRHKIEENNPDVDWQRKQIGILFTLFYVFKN